MSINHRRLDVAMAQEFLNRSDIITTFEQVSGEGVPERVAGGPLRQSSLRDRVSHGFLNQRFINVMAALFPGLSVHLAIGLLRAAAVMP